ncbi:unnamed protein product [Paramecium sonneborni]|uniref:RING-type domain-containing protein n=1 Tax=Paramecium sonneborni TaxID=65129 RepID=A0A8S1K867_9CILI|nr:unnamed protein product [Paramecium sonneborni]
MNNFIFSNQTRPQPNIQNQNELATIIIDPATRLSQLIILLIFTNAYILIYTTYLMLDYELIVLIVFYWIIDIIVILTLSILKIKYKITVGNLLIDTFLAAIFKTTILINFTYSELDIQYFSYVIMAYYFIRSVVINIRKIAINENITQYSFLVQGVKILLVLQLMLITMRWKCTIYWSWYTTFSVAWGLLVICFIVHFVFLLSIGETLIDYYKKKTTKTQLVGGIWLTFYLCGFSGIPMWFCYILCQNQEAKNFPTSDQATLLCILIISYNLSLLVITAVCKAQLTQFIKDMGFDIEIPQEPVVQEEKLPYHFLKISLPQKLIQISSTYFDFSLEQNKQFKQQQHVSNSNFSVVNQKARLKAFEFMAKTEQINSPVERESGLVKNEEKCQVCFDNEPQIVMLPCQHGGICDDCLQKCLKKSPNCYLCRKKIQKLLRVSKETSGKFAINDIALCDA